MLRISFVPVALGVELVVVLLPALELVPDLG